jgi:hypothetical protein
LIMTVGLPGVGIGGIFYLASAILMPVREAVRLGRGSNRGRILLVVRQTALAATILAALWATGWAVGHVIAAATPSPVALSRGRHASDATNVLKVSALALSLGTLALVLAMVQVARLVVRLRSPARVGHAALVPPPVAPQAESLRVDSGTFGRRR